MKEKKVKEQKTVSDRTRDTKPEDSSVIHLNQALVSTTLVYESGY